MEEVNVCTSPPNVELLQIPASPNPIEMNSAAKLHEFGNHMTNLQQKIDLISSKSKIRVSLTPPPIQETGDVEKDFETVFAFNQELDQLDASTLEKEVFGSSLVLPPPPLPKSAPPRETALEFPVPPPAIKKPPPPATAIKPWQKQHEYRPMSAVLREKQVEDPLKDIQFNFKPIGTVASSEDVRVDEQKLVVPLAIYSSKSVDNLTDEPREPKQFHGSLDTLFTSKSPDDLVMPDIDGIQGIRVNKYKKNRHAIRPSVSEEIFQVDLRPKAKNDEPEEEVYENLEKMKGEVYQLKMEAADLDRRKAERDIFIRPVIKKPQPLPRIGSESELDRSSKTLSFVFDADANEFVLESQRDEMPTIGVIERNSALLQQRSSSTSNIVPIKVANPKKLAPATGQQQQKQFRSLDSLDFSPAPEPTAKNKPNEKGNFFNLRFFKKDKDKDRPPIEPVRQSVFYSDSVDLIALDDQKFVAKLVHITSEDEELEVNEDTMEGSSHHYEEVLDVHETFNRSLSTFGQQNLTQGSRKFALLSNVLLSKRSFYVCLCACK